MSISAYLVCPSRGLVLRLGKRLRDSEHAVIGFSTGQRHSSEDPELTRALWKFLADTAGEELRVKFSDDEEFEVIAGYRLIGGWSEDGDVSIADYLRDGIPSARDAPPVPRRSAP